MNSYICNICSYEYDPVLGDSYSVIKPKTPFSQLPDSWVCPICKAPKKDFREVVPEDF